MIVRPRYGIYPYQPARGLNKLKYAQKAFKIYEKSVQKSFKKVTICNKAWTQQLVKNQSVGLFPFVKIEISPLMFCI